MIDQLPALQIVLPLLGAPVCSILSRRGWAWPFAQAVAVATFAVAVTLMRTVSAHGPMSYALGGWDPPYGIELRVDLLSALMLVLVSGIAVVVFAASPKSLAREVGEDRLHLVYATFLLCLTGLLGIAITGDLFNVFVFLEVSSLSTYTLIALGRDRRCLTAALNYLFLGTIGATFILISIGLLFSTTGTLNMADMAARLSTDSRTVVTAFAFFTVGVGLKMAIFPLHLWLPNAYGYAPSIATAFLAATATKVSVYVFLRFVFSIYGEAFAFGTFLFHFVLMPLAIVGTFAMSFVAIFQRDVKRLLAYSSVAQVGYMVLGASMDSVDGVAASITHILNHALMKGALFLALAGAVYRLGSSALDDLAGLGKRMPWTSCAFVIAGLSLIGVPATAGFVSKWALLQSALDQGLWPAAAAILGSSLLAVAYVWRVVETFYFRPLPMGVEERRDAPLGMLVPTVVLAGANVFFGLRAEWTLGVAQRAAAALLGAS